MNCLEWQVVGSRRSLEGVCCYGSRLGSYLRSLCYGCLCCGRNGRCCLGSTRCRSCLTAVDTEGTNVVEPTAIVFVCIDVKVNSQQFAYLYVECLQPVNAENVEDELARKVARNLQHIGFGFPLITCSVAYATAFIKFCYNLTCCFHFYSLFVYLRCKGNEFNSKFKIKEFKIIVLCVFFILFLWESTKKT